MILLSLFCSSILSCKQIDEFGVLIGLVVVVVMFMQQSNIYRGRLSKPASTLLFVVHDCTAVMRVFRREHALLYRSQIITTFSFVVVVVMAVPVMLSLLFLLFCCAGAGGADCACGALVLFLLFAGDCGIHGDV